MNTYTTLAGREIHLPKLPPKVAAFVERCRAATENPRVTRNEIIAMVYGPENPVFDHDFLPGRTMVTTAVIADEVGGPVYRVLSDMIGRKEVAESGADVAKMQAAYTIDVPTAAKELGLTQQAVRSAIESWRLSAIFRDGQWWLRPEALASHKVSKAGRPKSAATRERSEIVTAKVGGTPGASLSVRVESGELTKEKTTEGTIRRFPAGWTRAVVKTTSPSGTRTLLIEPSDEASEIEHRGLFVRGAFKIVQKFNSTEAANEAWKQLSKKVTA